MDRLYAFEDAKRLLGVQILVAVKFYALGILEPLDKLMKREEPSILRVKKEKRRVASFP